MSFKMNKLFRKWSCFGGKTSTTEEETQCRIKIEQPKIVITEFKSDSPTISRKNSNSSLSSSSDSMSDEEVEYEVMLNTDGEVHMMGLCIEIKSRKLDQTDGNDNEDFSVTRVKDVEIGSFAHGFGIRKGDDITQINGTACVADIFEIKKAFLSERSEDLQLEILRRSKNVETGETDILQMTLSNARRVGGTTIDEVKIIKVDSSWSLTESDSEYFLQEERKYLLQFAAAGIPWVVPESAGAGFTMGLTKDLSLQEVETRAKFCFHVYYSFTDMPDDGLPVVMQHVHSGRCVALVENEIKLVEVDQLETVTDRSIIFIQRMFSPSSGGSNQTFQSAMNPSLYLGFDTQSANGVGNVKPIKVSCTQSFQSKEKNIVFIVNDA